MNFKKIISNLCILFSLVLLTGCSEEYSLDDIKEKVISEISYLDSKILFIANSLNGITTENYKVDTIKISDSKSEPSIQENGKNGEEGKSGGEQGGGNSSEKIPGMSENGGEKNSGSSGGSESSNSSSGSNSSEQNTILITNMKTTSILSNSEQKVEWKNIKAEVELLYNTWNTIILDLYKIEVPVEEVSNFSSNLNQLVISAKNEDKSNTVSNLNLLYSNLSRYMEYASSDSYNINLQNTKQHLVSAYSNIEKEDWENVINEVNYAIDSYSPIITYLGHSEKKMEYSINKIYVMLNELKNAISNKEKDLFYINYKNLMNELSVI